MPIGILVLVGVVLLTVVIVVAAIKAERRRTENLRATARKMKFTFTNEDNEVLRNELGHFDLFSSGRGRRINTFMQGRAADLDIAIFDYRYRTGSGKSSNTWNQTVVLFESADQSLPTFSLRPEHLFHKIGQAFGYADIDFDAHPEFSKRYLLRGPNEKDIRRIFRRDLIRFFERRDDKLTVEAAGGRLLCFRPGKRVGPEKIEDFVKQAVAVYAQVRGGK